MKRKMFIWKYGLSYTLLVLMPIYLVAFILLIVVGYTNDYFHEYDYIYLILAYIGLLVLGFLGLALYSYAAYYLSPIIADKDSYHKNTTIIKKEKNVVIECGRTLFVYFVRVRRGNLKMIDYFSTKEERDNFYNELLGKKKKKK